MDIKERLRIVTRNVASVARSLLSVVNFFKSAMYPPFHGFSIQILLFLLLYNDDIIQLYRELLVVEILFKF